MASDQGLQAWAADAGAGRQAAIYTVDKRTDHGKIGVNQAAEA